MSCNDIYVPWEENMELGDCYDIKQRCITARPYEAVAPTPYRNEGDTYDYSISSVKNESDFKKAIENNIGARGGMRLIWDAEISNQMMRSVHYDEKCLTTVLHHTITRRTKECIKDLRLREDAKALLKASWWPFSSQQTCLDDFTRKYGQYYISTYISQASITIFSRYKFASRQAKERYESSGKTKYSWPTGQKLSAEELFRHLRKYGQSTMEEEFDVRCKGFKQDKIFTELTSKDVTKVVDQFLKCYEPQKILAILRPLQTLDASIPRDLPVPDSRKAKDEWINSMCLVNRAKLSNMQCAQEPERQLLSQLEDLREYIVFRKTDSGELQRLVTVRKSLERDVTRAERRQRVLSMQRDSEKVPTKHNWTEAGRQRYVWSYGVGPDLHQLSDEIKHHTESGCLEGFVLREETTMRINCGQRRIIGVRIKSENQNGFWKFNCNQTTDSVVEIMVRSPRIELASYELECWSVDPELYKEI